MHQASWLRKTHIVGPLLYSARVMEGIVRHNRMVTHRHRNPEGLPFLDVSDGRTIEEINALSTTLLGVRLARIYSCSLCCACGCLMRVCAISARSAAPQRAAYPQWRKPTVLTGELFGVEYLNRSGQIEADIVRDSILCAPGADTERAESACVAGVLTLVVCAHFFSCVAFVLIQTATLRTAARAAAATCCPACPRTRWRVSADTLSWTAWLMCLMSLAGKPACELASPAAVLHWRDDSCAAIR